MTTDTTRDATPLTLDQRARRMAVRALVETIESECPRVRLAGHSWWDTRPMVDPREHAPQVIDINAEILDLALTMGVIVRHTQPDLQHIVRVVADAELC